MLKAFFLLSVGTKNKYVEWNKDSLDEGRDLEATGYFNVKGFQLIFIWIGSLSVELDFSKFIELLNFYMKLNIYLLF